MHRYQKHFFSYVLPQYSYFLLIFNFSWILSRYAWVFLRVLRFNFQSNLKIMAPIYGIHHFRKGGFRCHFCQALSCFVGEPESSRSISYRLLQIYLTQYLSTKSPGACHGHSRSFTLSLLLFRSSLYFLATFSRSPSCPYELSASQAPIFAPNIHSKHLF